MRRDLILSASISGFPTYAKDWHFSISIQNRYSQSLTHFTPTYRTLKSVKSLHHSVSNFRGPNHQCPNSPFPRQVLILRKAQEDLEKEAKRKEEERVSAINELVPPLDINGFDEGEFWVLITCAIKKEWYPIENMRGSSRCLVGCHLSGVICSAKELNTKGSTTLFFL